jgi:hypothetical protein
MKPTSLALAAAGIAASLLFSSPPAQAAASTFRCDAWLTQSCHYAIVRNGQAERRFTLHRGERREAADVAPGDAYMMSVNFDPPASVATCSRAPHPELKRSQWCRIGQVREGVNP